MGWWAAKPGMTVVVLTCATACTGGDRTVEPGPETFDEMLHEIAVVTCAAIEDCGWPVGYLAHAPSVPLAGVRPASGIDVESDNCVAEIECQYDGVGREIRAAMESGTLIYDPAGAARCLAALRGRCIWLSRAEGGSEYLQAMCGDVFTGSDGVGEACEADGCTIDDVCTGGGFDSCVTGAACVDGVCVAGPSAGDSYRGPGSPCGDGCAEGLLCSGGLCAEPPRIGIGESCLGDDLRHCASGLSCVVTEGAATCQAPLSSGSACGIGFPDPCPDGEVCIGATESMPEGGTCTTLPSEGEPCAPAFPRCAGDLVCGPDRTCIPLACAP